MSNYLSSAINPKTGKLEECAMLDDFYGHHNYGVLFLDDGIYDASDIKFNDSCWDEFNTDKAYEERPEEYKKVY